jgi:Asp-tRNA(Asn)/Glu-tRNA(Gln) amidotransferase A subunit family amidase
MADAFSLPTAEIAVLLGGGKLKARALAEEAIANHERFGAKLMAYSQWAPEHARQCADAADAAFAVGSRAGSLQGIPTSIKDLFAVAGFPTYAGSPKRLPPKFEIEGPVVANLRRQLATMMGKTHMVEFAFGGTARMRITAARAILGTRRRIARPVARRAAPASRSARARRSWPLAAIPLPRCAYPPR